MGDLLQGPLEQLVVVAFEVDLAAHGQHPAVQLQEIAVGQAALFLVAFGPGIAEVDIDAVHLAGGEEVRQAGGVAVHKEHVVQPRVPGPLHGHHHGVGDLFHGDQQHVRLGGGGLRREAALAAAQLHPQLPGIGQKLPPAAPQGTGVRHQQGTAGFHPGQQILFLSHAHGSFPPVRPWPQIKYQLYIYHKIHGSVNEKNAPFGAGDGFVTGL